MIDELNASITQYKEKWLALVAERENKTFFEALKPTSVAWKTKNLADYTRCVAELHDHCDHIFEVWLNGRWIAKMHLKEDSLAWGLSVVKIMQRRPGSTDAPGLDHIDFYTADTIESILKTEPNLTWNYEKNNAEWYSVWSAAGEAKLRNDTICKVCADELMVLHDKILK